MNYRVKIKVYGDGRKEYYPQVRWFFLWMGIDCDGEAEFVDLRSSTLSRAERCIDKHIAGGGRLERVEYVYREKE